jgi:hypothetical protein
LAFFFILAFFGEKNFTDKIFLIIKNFLITIPNLQNFHPLQKFPLKNQNFWYSYRDASNCISRSIGYDNLFTCFAFT